jgi:putative phosphoribosyl transferase
VVAQRKPDYDEVSVGPLDLPGMLEIPAGAQGIVLFAHGSGSGRFSPRNNYVAKELRRAGLATLLFDLLTPEEEGDRAKVFDIGLLAGRLAEAAAWTARRPDTADLAVGLFGSSTGAAAALVASVLTEAEVGAIVSRGGRPDLAGPALPLVSAPTLMLVGSLDGPVIELNKQAYAQLQTVAELRIIPGAGHLFEEPGTLEEVVVHARDWFVKHLGEAARERTGHVPPRAPLH